MADGKPTWTVQDPSRNQFFRLDWQTFEVLNRWSLGDAQAIVDSVNAGTTLEISLEDIQAVIDFLEQHQLVQLQGKDSTSRYVNRKERQHSSPMKQLLHHYLFFRIPLVRPDRWLTHMLPVASMFYSRWFIKLTLTVGIAGFVQVYREWDRFQATFMDLLSWEGAFSIGLAIIAVKIAHEFGHAFTAKRYGCRVPTMGVAFLVLWPVAYTDTNEVWKLPGRKQRLAVASAGIVTELVVAIWATLAWVLLPEGTPKAIAFLFATTSWIATLAINASPFMRFDGYFLLSDWLDMPNLHERSFALARWQLRELLFKLGEPEPEHFNARRKRGLILFAWGTWLYRLVVFLGIAVLVYHFFIKALGILLFIVEILWFVLLPLLREFAEWYKRRQLILTRVRSWLSIVLVCMVIGLLWLPLPSRIRTSGLLHPSQEFNIYAPYAAQIGELVYINGDKVRADTPLVVLVSKDLQGRWRSANAKIQRLKWQLTASHLDAEQRMSMRVIQQDLAAAQSEWKSVRKEVERNQPLAPFDGIMRDVDPNLRPGVWVAARQRLGMLVQDKTMIVETYLDEETVRRIQPGASATFYPEEPSLLPVKLEVRAIDRDATHVLPIPILASHFGGTVMTREKNNKHIPETAVYRVVLDCEPVMPEWSRHIWSGDVVIDGEWISPAEILMNRSLALLRREAGF
jgi:putative peptide zinc metalloprotease protein